MRLRIIWDISHHEFTILDYYYFSSLETFLKQRAILVENRSPLNEILLNPNDILVINYPEVEFDKSEINQIEKFVREGGKLLVSAYYQNEDFVASICSKLLFFAEIRFNEDGVFSESDGLLTTAKVAHEAKQKYKNIDFERVYFPCSCSIEGNDLIPLLKVENSIVSVVKEYGKGKIIALGTAVFWDNFALDREDNWKFVNWLFS
ncbi:MAG: DUF4350 domain-containing protein [Actinobacteria bacterium]|nr:DUF4350 domain-containing protein [Actinomycetota bacterium]